MKTLIDREPRGPKEGVALNVRVTSGPPEHWQVKIDVWSEKGTGQYRMRLDGFAVIRLYEAASVQELFMQLASLDVAGLVAQSMVMQEKIKQAWAEAPEPVEIAAAGEMTIAEYFEAARKAMLKELQPLVVLWPD
jgi:hypothetical protein